MQRRLRSEGGATPVAGMTHGHVLGEVGKYWTHLKVFLECHMYNGQSTIPGWKSLVCWIPPLVTANWLLQRCYTLNSIPFTPE